MKAIMISIKPKWVAKILNGEKIIEIRKTCPDLFKGWGENDSLKYSCGLDVYIYCTKDKKHKLEYCDINAGCWSANDGGDYYNGKVVAKFTLNKVEVIKLPYTKFGCSEWVGCEAQRTLQTKTLDEKDLLKLSCLEEDEIYHYLNFKHSPDNVGYAWHISNLVIFDKPKEISEFHNAFKYKRVESFFGNNNIEKDERTGGLRQPVRGGYEYVYPLTKAPQNFCYVEVDD